MANEYNYFTQNIQKAGEEFLAFKNARDFEREAPMIFRQLARRQIDLSKYGHYFLEKQFLESCINVASKKVMFHSTSANGIFFHIDYLNRTNSYVDPYEVEVYKSHYETSEAYSVVYRNLVALRDSENLGYLKTLANILSTNRALGNAL